MKFTFLKLQKFLYHIYITFANSKSSKNENVRIQFYLDLWKKTSKDLGATIEDFGGGYSKIIYKGKWTIVKNQYVMLDNPIILGIAGKKPLIYKILQNNNISIPNHCVFNYQELEKAKSFLKASPGPCVVKPAQDTAAGGGITTNISTNRALKKAILFASQFGNPLLIEDQIPGNSYRLLFLEGKFIDAIKRDPPSIIADGVHSITELIKLENVRRSESKKKDTVTLLKINSDCKFTLKDQGFLLKDIPDKGTKIKVQQVVNNNTAMDNTSLSQDEISGVLNECEEVLKLVPVKLAGIDIIAPTLEKPLSVTGGVINEINTTPGFHFHYYIKNVDAKKDVASLILKHLLNIPD
jgi:cyanophycin synthetase